MSDSAIADVSETLLKVLRDRLSGLVAPDHVTLASPADIELDTSPWLGLFLYQVAENPHLRNEEPSRPEPSRIDFPPTVVDLNYLAVPYAQTRDDELKIVGRVIQALAAQPVLRGAILQRGLAGSGEELKVVPHAPTMDELSRLWTTFNNKPYKLSLGYQVTPVKIASAREPVEVQPVLERNLRLSRI
jgi:uncharacterized protein DUF4255